VKDEFVRAFDWLVRDRKSGKVVIAQLPNVPLVVFLVASAVRRVVEPEGTLRTVVGLVATGALVWWAVDEVLRGVNPLRRLVGGAVLLATVAALVLR
jgi:hypothetical protein